MPDTEALGRFVSQFTTLVDRAAHNEQEMLRVGGSLLATLVAQDDWLPEEFSRPDPRRYMQYLLHCDSADRFSVVSFVWGPGQTTPVHDHTVWGLIGMLRGAEHSERYAVSTEGGPLQLVEQTTLERGEIDQVSPTIGDIHRVSNAHEDRVSISIHVYGGDIGKVRRHTYDLETGHRKTFISGFDNVRIQPSDLQ